MPIYEYRCEKCGHRIEKIQKFSDPALTECDRCKGKLTKVFSPSALQFKGSGFYITDYTDKGKPPKGDGESKDKPTPKSPADVSEKSSSTTEKSSSTTKKNSES